MHLKSIDVTPHRNIRICTKAIKVQQATQAALHMMQTPLHEVLAVTSDAIMKSKVEALGMPSHLQRLVKKQAADPQHLVCW